MKPFLSVAVLLASVCMTAFSGEIVLVGQHQLRHGSITSSGDFILTEEGLTENRTWTTTTTELMATSGFVVKGNGNFAVHPLQVAWGFACPGRQITCNASTVLLTLRFNGSSEWGSLLPRRSIEVLRSGTVDESFPRLPVLDLQRMTTRTQRERARVYVVVLPVDAAIRLSEYQSVSLGDSVRTLTLSRDHLDALKELLGARRTSPATATK